MFWEGSVLEWTEIKIKVPLCDTETAEAIANMVVPYGIYVEDYSELEKDALEIAHIDKVDVGNLQHVLFKVGIVLNLYTHRANFRRNVVKNIFKLFIANNLYIGPLHR